SAERTFRDRDRERLIHEPNLKTRLVRVNKKGPISRAFLRFCMCRARDARGHGKDQSGIVSRSRIIELPREDERFFSLPDEGSTSRRTSKTSLKRPDAGSEPSSIGIEIWRVSPEALSNAGPPTDRFPYEASRSISSAAKPSSESSRRSLEGVGASSGTIEGSRSRIGMRSSRVSTVSSGCMLAGGVNVAVCEN